MTDFWFDYIINDLENMEYRIEDIVLHAMTGLIVGLLIHIKNIWKNLVKLVKINKD